MRVIRGLHNLRPGHRGCVATIGNFDGVHLGHRAVFQRLLAKGRDLGLPATVITFEPQAMEYFAPEAAPARLTRLREKLAALQACGIERVVLLEFGHKLAQLEARAFVEELLVDGLAARHLLVGDDFRFGRGRKGDFALLRTLGAEHGFVVEDLHTITHGAERVSSTRIRETLARGELDLARHLLGRPYRICGRVAHGNQRGRTIGFPTININLHRRVSPLHGVYAVMVDGLLDRPWPAWPISACARPWASSRVTCWRFICSISRVISMAVTPRWNFASSCGMNRNSPPLTSCGRGSRWMPAPRATIWGCQAARLPIVDRGLGEGTSPTG